MMNYNFFPVYFHMYMCSYTSLSLPIYSGMETLNLGIYYWKRYLRNAQFCISSLMLLTFIVILEKICGFHRSHFIYQMSYYTGKQSVWSSTVYTL